MNHQDWEPVIISNNKHNPVKKQVHIGVQQINALENATEVGKLKELSIPDRQIMISMRAAKGLKQDQLSQALSMPVNIYKNIENGKTIPNQQQLNKINNYLKINLKLT